METQRGNENADAEIARLDIAASEHVAPLPSRPIDAQDAVASLDTMAFDSSLSFLDNIDDLADSMMSLLDTDTVFSSPTPVVVASVTAGPLDVLKREDELGGSVHGVMESKSPQEETGTVKQLSPTVHPKPANTSRARQKEELEYLRSQVVELEAELAQLKSAPESPSSPTEPSVWEKIAKRQNEEKQKAAIENAKLRSLLEGQLKVAMSLEKLLNKRALCQSDSQYTERKRLRTTHEMDVSAIVEEIRSRIHLQFDDVDTVMDQCGVSCINVDTEDVQATTRSMTDNTICMEITMVKVLPFPLDEAADVVWQVTSGHRIEFENGYFGASCRTESTCDLQVAVKMRLRRAEAVVHVNGVGARRTKANRSMIVFETIGRTEGTLFADSPIRCRERGYASMENNEASNEPPSTIARVCVRVWPDSVEREEETTDPSQNFKAFVDLVIGSYSQNTKTMFQLVENILLEQSLTRAHGNA